MEEKLDLRGIDPGFFRDRDISLEQILNYFDEEDAYWVYRGEPRPDAPHAKLTSGKCSNGFIDCLKVLRYPGLAEIFGRQLGRRLRQEGLGDVDWVISSPYAAITFGHEVAKELGAIFMFCEKDPKDPKGKGMLWRRMQIPAGQRVLQVEELITTSSTLKEIRRAVETGNANPVDFIPIVGALVHRPEKLPMAYDGREVVALIEKQIRIFDPGPETCPYCAAGSEALRPKQNWAELTGKK